MNKLVLALIPLFFNTLLFAQTAQSIIKQSTHFFILDENGSFAGEGSEILKKNISESQFFLLGEQHDIQAIEQFTKAVIPFLKDNGFENFAMEIGPIAADKLKQLKRQKVSLKDFNGRYAPHVKSAPFGFYGTEEEESTLRQAFDLSINLWGIDFENYGSYLFLIDELYENSDDGKVPEELYQEVYAFIVSEYNKGKDGYNPELMENVLNSEKVSLFLKQAENNRNNPIMEQFLKSLFIYEQQRKGHWWPRTDNMKSNFVAQYQKLQEEQQNPLKVFVKLGAVHTARGTSFSGFQDVGNTVYELARFNGTKSYSIISFPRYISDEKDGTIEDEVEESGKELLEFTTPEKWSLIDLKELEMLRIEHKIRLSEPIKSYIQKYDAMLIPPATTYSTKNY